MFISKPEAICPQCLVCWSVEAVVVSGCGPETQFKVYPVFKQTAAVPCRVHQMRKLFGPQTGNWIMSLVKWGIIIHCESLRAAQIIGDRCSGLQGRHSLCLLSGEMRNSKSKRLKWWYSRFSTQKWIALFYLTLLYLTYHKKQLAIWGMYC